MDNKTWQVNLGGSMITVQGNRALQAQHLPSPTGSAYPGGATNHWHQMTCCSGFNAVMNSQSMASHQQFNQIQQPPPLRYFQIQTPATNTQHGNQISTANLGQLQYGTHRPHHQQHFAHLYAVLRTSSNDLLRTEGTSQYGRREDPTSTQGLPFTSTEDGAIYQYRHHHDRREQQQQQLDNNHEANLDTRSKLGPNLISTVDRPSKDRILTNSRFTIPESTQTSSFSVMIDHVSPQSRGLIGTNEGNFSGFINAIEAVPDMLREVRPGSTNGSVPEDPKPYFLVDEAEFSYHTNKPELEVETSLETTDFRMEKNWPELSLRNHRSYASIIDRKIVGLRFEESMCSLAECTSVNKDITTENINFDVKSGNSLKSLTEKIVTNSQIQRTYADAVQLTSRQEIPLPWQMKINEPRKNVRRIKLSEGSRKTTNARWSPTSEMISKEIEARCTRQKREHECCDEENDCCTIFRSNSPEKSENFDPLTSRNFGIFMDDRKSCSIRPDGHQADKCPSRKRLCKMAEMFCFDQLENAKFVRAFDDHDRCRRRMSYTRKIENRPEVASRQQDKICSKCHIHGEMKFIAELKLDRRDLSLKLERNLDFPNCRSICEGSWCKDLATFSQLNINGMIDRGVFKVLQKLKECADGTGALYTNSWKPEEIHFLRRSQRNKVPL